MMNKIIFIAFLALVIFEGCSMNEQPVTTPDKEAIFSSEEGLKAYSLSFYDGLPTATGQGNIEQSLADYVAPRSLNAFVTKGAYSENNSSGWSWSVLRNINYFIDNCDDPNVSEEVRNNYLGLARFFRAWFYYDKVRRFGDVPWVDHALEPQEDDILFEAQDSRDVVMNHVYDDLIFAGENISRTDDAAQASLVTKWAAYALASRIALFEGSYEKYHNLQLETSPDTWFERAADAAKEVMDNSGKSLHNDFRALFTSDDPPLDETILAIASSESLGVRSSLNWDWASETKGSSPNLIRSFVNTFLQEDGTPYTDKSGWRNEDFYEEFQDRDERLYASLRYPGYTREGQLTLPVFDGYARIGYQPIKFSVDDPDKDDKTTSTQAVQLIRLGEVLLNYAEAKAELGTLTDQDWSNTVGALRTRAGITGGDINTKPTTVDDYFQSTYFPNISDPAILEIRRERGVELLFEGFRFDDIRRWKVGDLFKRRWTGMYIKDVNTPLDMDHNGTDDVIYYTSESGRDAALNQSNNPDIMQVEVSDDSNFSAIQIQKADNGIGYYLVWYGDKESDKVWGDKQYLYPIPVDAINKNQNLIQNPGWEDGATNDGN